MRSSPGPWVHAHRAAVRAATALTLLCLIGAPAFARPKSDVVVVRNGDRLKGEIKSLKYGRLQLDTDSMGTISIEWPDVVAVQSPFLFTIESSAGDVLVGTLAMTADSSRVVIGGPATAIETPLSDISRLSQLQKDFWGRIDGHVSLGFTYEKSTEITLLNARFDSQYLSRRFESGLTASADVSNAPGQETQQNFSAGYSLRMLVGGSRFWFGGVSWQRNEELGIASRLQVAVGPGRYLLRSPETEVSSYLGIVSNQEWALGSNEGTLSAEVMLGGDWRTFRFRDPETSIVATFFFLPSLTESGRYRTDLGVTFSREVITDLTTDLSYHLDTDNKPPAEGTTLDTGISFSIGYKF